MTFKQANEVSSKTFGDSGTVIAESTTFSHISKSTASRLNYNFSYVKSKGVIQSVTVNITKEPIEGPNVLVGNIWKDNGTLRCSLKEEENFIEIFNAFQEYLQYINK